jgi:hypothetical protein
MTDWMIPYIAGILSLAVAAYVAVIIEDWRDGRREKKAGRGKP